MNHRTILLIGSGFIAHALLRQLAAEGREVHVLSHHPAPADFPSSHWHQGDLRNRDVLCRLLKMCGTVAHLASLSTPSASAQRPTLEVANLEPTLALLELLQDFPQTHLIYFSSGGTLYGNPAIFPVTESAPMRPVSFYGAGKAAQELFLQILRDQGMPITILRPANAYGPNQPLKSGFGLVRTVLEHLNHGTNIEIWGDGEAVRDYVFVDDIASACQILIDRHDDCETYNVGSGMGHSINELIALAEKISGRSPRVIHRPSRQTDVSKVVLSIDKLQALGWRPATSLETGLRQTWAWLRKYGT